MRRETFESFRFPHVLTGKATRNSCYPVMDRTLLNQRENRPKQVLPIQKRSHPFAIFNCQFPRDNLNIIRVILMHCYLISYVTYLIIEFHNYKSLVLNVHIFLHYLT